MIAYFLSPYEVSVKGSIKWRSVRIDEFTSAIDSDHGYWSECEIQGDQAIVKVRASETLINQIANTYKRIDNPADFWTETRDDGQPSRLISCMEKDVLSDEDHLALKAQATAIISEVNEKGYVRLDCAWEDATKLLGMLNSKGYNLDKVSTGTFPTTSVKTNFTGADENPLSESSHWTGPSYSGSHAMKRVSNTAGGSTTGGGVYNDSYWSYTTFGPDLEAYFTLSTKEISSARDFGLDLRLRNPNTGNENGYEIDWDQQSGTDVLAIARIDAGAYTQLGAGIAIEVTEGNKIGGECIGSSISAYLDTGSGWTLKGTRTDSTYGAAGYIGMFCESDVMRMDDFGGGTVGVSSSSSSSSSRSSSSSSSSSSSRSSSSSSSCSSSGSSSSSSRSSSSSSSCRSSSSSSSSSSCRSSSSSSSSSNNSSSSSSSSCRSSSSSCSSRSSSSSSSSSCRSSSSSSRSSSSSSSSSCRSSSSSSRSSSSSSSSSSRSSSSSSSSSSFKRRVIIVC